MSGESSIRRIAVLSGSGISAESGIKTFRDSGGLWEEFRVEDVATPEAFARNPALVLEFYNQRRKQVIEASPNAAHHALVELEKKYHVDIITQNVDDLHERAGSTRVLHLHGEIRKARSVRSTSKIYDIDGWQINPGDLAEDGGQLRPHIVWFGELVPNIEPAQELVARADLFIVVGTSLAVYPAAGLLYFTKPGIPRYLVDPEASALPGAGDFNLIPEMASSGLKQLVKSLLAIS